jgi:hypothetical protein
MTDIFGTIVRIHLSQKFTFHITTGLNNDSFNLRAAFSIDIANSGGYDRPAI